MMVKIEVLDYADRMNAYEAQRVVVKDSGMDSKMVEIVVGDKTVKVIGEEMIDAIGRCLNANPIYPY